MASSNFPNPASAMPNYVRHRHNRVDLERPLEMVNGFLQLPLPARIS